MQYIQLDRTGLKLSLICLGTVNIGVDRTEAESFEWMDRYLELGGNFIDTALLFY